MDRDKPINLINNIKSLEQLRKYLQQHSQQNLSMLVDKNDNTLLNIAAMKNDLNRIKIYIKHYKEFTQINHGTGLYSGQSTFVDKLRAWVNAPNKDGYIPILYAAYHGNITMIKFLQECGSNMYYKTTKNQNVLFMCLEQNKIKAIINFVESTHQYDINHQNINGDTILHIACSKGHTQLVSYLLTIGAEIQSKNNEGLTPLLVATREQKRYVIKLLLIKGANRRAKDNLGRTSIQLAKEKQNTDIVKILNDDYTFCEKVKIKCNKKLVFQPQHPSYLYSLFFIGLFHLFFIPTNLYSEFRIPQRYIKLIPDIVEGMYYLIVMIIYCLLLKKPKKKIQEKLQQIDGNFCAECKSKMNSKVCHCYICERCINRYDHHCPWINNCVGAHNVGKFTIFLLLLILGCAQVTFCNAFFIAKSDKYVQYRKLFNIPDPLKLPLSIITVIFCLLMLIGLFNLLFQQLRNLFTNSTSVQRKKAKKPVIKKQLLASQASQGQLTVALRQTDDETLHQSVWSCNWFDNCKAMLQEEQ